MVRHIAGRTILILVLAFAFGIGCESSAGPEPEVSLAVVDGDNQSGGFGGELPNRVAVRVAHKDGTPVPDEQVVWRVAAGGGRTDSLITRTDSEGVARVRWELGMDSGAQLLSATVRNASLAIRASASFQFASVTVGFKHACALSTSGEAFCWGDNASGQLGDGTETPRANMTRVLGTKRFRFISAGWTHTCGLSFSGEALCWGNNQLGQLGISGAAAHSHTPAPVSSAAAFESISAGFVHTCAVAVDGTAFCWGANNRGQLGSNAVTPARPTAVDGATKYKNISAGEFHTCATASTGEAFCWGWNSTGELGANTAFGEQRNSPVRVSTLVNVTAIAAGVRHTCAVADGLYCWGRNAVGETGAPPLVHHNTPYKIASVTDPIFTGAGDVISCAATVSNVFCLGANGVSTTALPLSRFEGPITSLAVGYDNVCTVSSGDVYCWGLGDASPVKITRPR